MVGPPVAPLESTAEMQEVLVPFLQLDADNPAEIRLQQVAPRRFKILEAFRYLHTATSEEHVIHAHDPLDPDDTTDLASAPGPLTWFVQRYGKHTLAALMHDQLVDQPEIEREWADTLFRDGLRDLRVRFVRRWIMWAAVSIGTLRKKARLRGAMAVVWLVPWIAIPLALLVSLLRWEWFIPVHWSAVLAIVLAGPLFLSAVFWARRYLVGVVSAYVVMLLAIPTVAVALAKGIYTLIELVGERIRPSSGVPPCAPLRVEVPLID